jgi:hypothetical protein
LWTNPTTKQSTINNGKENNKNDEKNEPYGE